MYIVCEKMALVCFFYELRCYVCEILDQLVFYITLMPCMQATARTLLIIVGWVA